MSLTLFEASPAVLQAAADIIDAALGGASPQTTRILPSRRDDRDALRALASAMRVEAQRGTADESLAPTDGST